MTTLVLCLLSRILTRFPNDSECSRVQDLAINEHPIPQVVRGSCLTPPIDPRLPRVTYGKSVQATGDLNDQDLTDRITQHGGLRRFRWAWNPVGNVTKFNPDNAKN